MDFTSIFFENLFGIMSFPFKTLGTTESSAITVSTTTSSSAAECLTDGINNFITDDGNALLGSTSVSSATATVATYLEVNNIDYPNIQMTKAYVESRDEEELKELIDNLYEIENELDSSEEANVLAKRI